MEPTTIPLERITVDNLAFRRVIETSKEMQLVLMSLKVGEDIGMEIHPHTTQFIRVEEGRGVAILNGEKTKLKPGDAVWIPSGTQHNIINTGNERLSLYTIYAPPKHPQEQ